MSVYKVPQDVEAEDKLVGPFTLKQFIFLIVAAISGYLTFVLATVNLILIIFTLPLTIIFAVLGIYRRPDQPVELYLASLARFYLKPRRRIWDQDGIMEPVKITVPPKEEHQYTDGRSQEQVVGQLSNLANIMDTRGWAAKNSNLQVPNQVIAQSDRLVGINELPAITQPTEIHSADDMYDVANNQVAQNLNNMATQTFQQAPQTNSGYLQQQPVQAQPTNQYGTAMNSNQSGQQGFQLYPTGNTDRQPVAAPAASAATQPAPQENANTAFDPNKFETSAETEAINSQSDGRIEPPKRKIDGDDTEISLR